MQRSELCAGSLGKPGRSHRCGPDAVYQGPDFPTAGIVYTGGEGEEDGLLAAYSTGRGKITMRARAHIEELGRGRSRIVITEIPYQTNKSNLIERIVDVAQSGKIEGLVDLRDESDRQGLRIVIELGRTADSGEVLSALFKYTPLQATYGIIMLALLDGEPRMLSLKQMLRAFIEHRLTIIQRRSAYDLARAQARAHILEGLLVALENIDRVIDIIRRSRTTETAHTNLRKEFGLSDEQATAILDMQLRRLAALERRKLEDELKEKRQLIKDLTTLLESPKLQRLEIAREMQRVEERYATQRRTLVIQGPATDVTSGELIGTQENTWVTLTTSGKLSTPHDNEAPKVTASMKEPPLRVLESNPSDVLYLITTEGNCATLLTSQIPKVHEIEEGTPFWQLCDLGEGETVAQVITVPTTLEQGYLFFVTVNGEVKRLRLEELPSLRAQAFKVFDVEADDRLLTAFIVQEDDQVILVSRQGQAIHFKVDEVRATGLSAGGMRGIKLAAEEDRVVGANGVTRFAHVWVVTDGGYGKRTSAEEYPVQGRAGQGVRTLRFPPGEDRFIAAAVIGPLEGELVALTNRDKAKRNRLTNAPSVKRDSKGETIVSLAKDEQVSSAFLFELRPEVPQSAAVGEDD
ncbi:MAG: hypothetical protein HC915_09000 [Anaerolineae bacterium]|nr:hypothetical protein [Anaerolineae bacterium]